MLALEDWGSHPYQPNMASTTLDIMPLPNKGRFLSFCFSPLFLIEWRNENSLHYFHLSPKWLSSPCLYMEKVRKEKDERNAVLIFPL